VLVGQVDLVGRAVEAEADRLAVAVLDDGLVQIVDEVDDCAPCHYRSFHSLRL